MENPSKRRRIERRATGSLRALLHLDNKRRVLKSEGIVPLTTPDLVVSSSLDTTKDEVLPNPSSATLRVRASSVQKLELRGLVKPPVTDAVNQAQPVYNAADNTVQTAGKPADSVTQAAQQAAQPAANQVQQTTGNTAQPVPQAAQPVQQAAQPTVNQAQQTAGQQTQPVQQVAQPVLDQTPKAVNTVTQPAQQAAQPVANQVQQAGNTVAKTTQNQVGQPVVNGVNSAVEPVASKAPGDVKPPAAVAAAAAREEALAEQEAKAAKENPNVPSSEGPAPAKIPSTLAESQGPANPQDAKLLPASLQTAGSSTQVSLSELSTPGPQTPTASSTSSYFSTPAQQSPTPTGEVVPAALSNPSQLPSTNSTLTPSPTSTFLSGSSIQSTSTINSGSESFGLFGAFTASASPDSAIQTVSSSFSGLFTNSITPTPSTLITSTPTASNSGLGDASSTDLSSASGTGEEGFAGGNPTSGGPASASTTAGSGAGGSSGTPPTGALVGGICGGVAGLVLIIAALLFLLRYRKRKYDQRREISPPIPQSAGAGSAALGGGVMTQRSSTRSTAPIAAAANLIGRLRPGSSQTATTSTSTAPSEKGFQKISGRKLPSVLQSGGDGYGEKSAAAAATGSASKPPPSRNIAPGQSPFAGLAPALRPPSPQRSLSGSSFYRDSHGFYGGIVPTDSMSEDKTASSASPTSSSPTIPVGPSSTIPFAAAGHPPGRSSPGVPNIRPGPARQPVIQQGGVVPMRTPSRPGTSQQRPSTSPIAEHPHSRDPLGRSHPSQDGSRQSRFRESTTPP